MQPLVKHLFLAAKPSSLAATLLSVLIVPIAMKLTMFSTTFACSLAIVLLLHIGLNLFDSFWELRDAALVYGLKAVSPLASQGRLVLTAALLCCAGAGGLLYHLVSSSPTVIDSLSKYRESAEQPPMLVILLAVLSWFCVARPLGLKLRGLGDLVLSLCLGPLLAQCVALLLTGATQGDLVLLTLPLALLCVAATHGADTASLLATREEDEIAIAPRSLARTLGLELSLFVLSFLVMGAFVCAMVVAVLYTLGTLLVLPALFVSWPLLVLAFPLARSVDDKGDGAESAVMHVAEQVIKLHFFFGSLYLLGLVLGEILFPWSFLVVW